MKDLYSAHTSEEDLMNYYEQVKSAYSKIFSRLGFNFKVTKASGGVFTDKFTHEFQAISDAGEDIIYWKEGDEEAVNDEIFDGNKAEYKSAKSIEVGNIFPLGTWYAEKMGFTFTDEDGKKKPVWFGSYGIGITRAMGTLVEVNHDEKGILWPKNVAPFAVHLIELPGAKNVKEVYDSLIDKSIEVLWDDRMVSAGEKFSDADLIGIPVRLVVSEKTQDKIEWKERAKQKTELLSLDEVVKRLTA